VDTHTHSFTHSLTCSSTLQATHARTPTLAARALSQAVSLYSALSGTATVVTLTCVTDTLPQLTSCLLFEAVPSNESPSLARQNDAAAAYRFKSAPVATLNFNNVTDGTDKAGDVLLNDGNPIVTRLGVSPAYCNGEVAEYQGEDKAW
jgi:hypothetical protein